VNARTLVVVAVAAVLLAAQAGAIAFVTGFGPFDSAASGPEPATPAPSGGGGTAPADAGASGGDSGGAGDDSRESGDGGSGTGTPVPPPYLIDVLDTEKCGNTCRDVTVRLTNNRDEPAEGVSVHTQIFSGNTWAEDARVWEGHREVGRLAAGESTTTTARVSLSYFEALSVQRNGGWVTIVTTVESETTTETFRERQEVA
jgi:hypothetical protein